MAGRISGLADPNTVEKLAALYTNGGTNSSMAAALGVDRTTIIRWKKDPRFKAEAYRMHRDRVVQISRRIDQAIEDRLTPEKIAQMDVRDLLNIRKEMLGTVPKAAGSNVDPGAIALELWGAMDEDPGDAVLEEEIIPEPAA